ncbi:zinc-binding dehydrogenase [Pluralibacter gergoviae]|uniref:Zinc-binding dehydrogenase n=1 Tax=Pluralibacter gergoviae TaxID=61647 RepID=A0AAI9GNZ3_PLUGE|nr:zinc-binding dehydrogenase [Pluralibacter gergoviae]EKV0917360.1 zinc-binding dehydrogenase [Pluralibacter gergoviae]EKV9908271.1 zinc-binding dehydrogenase [Pluralibacter gergoviae]EKW7274398.1 zinc-binding dehydrogenase [Pluralibacter gergoviae]ELD4295832.1 zinc-binding dehydrogenase [Pluralibacter gergoviae]ELD4306133.1 zinc-binding dehydrogenase [Pluralibacter gergoviae]
MLPERYRAWIWRGGKLPAGLTLETTEMTPPAPGDAVVRLEAIGLNPVDWKLLEIKAGDVPGVDGAGRVVAVGEGVSQAWVGQRVAWHQDLRHTGSFAEYTHLQVRALMRIPPNLDSVSAAAFPCPGLTAWQALEKVPFRPGSRMLIGGAGGSVGIYLLQMAHRRGFIVDTLSDERHHALLSSLGANRCYATPSDPDGWQAEEKYDVIIDTSSPESYRWLTDSLRANGHFVAVLGRPESWPNAPFAQSFSFHEVALAALHAWGDDEDWRRLTQDGEQLLAQLEDGRMKKEQILIYEFDELAKALRRLQHRDFTGKLVVRAPADG